MVVQNRVSAFGKISLGIELELRTSLWNRKLLIDLIIIIVYFYLTSQYRAGRRNEKFLSYEMSRKKSFLLLSWKMWIWVTLSCVCTPLHCIWSQNGVRQQRSLVKIPCNTTSNCENFAEMKENEIRKGKSKAGKTKIKATQLELCARVCMCAPPKFRKPLVHTIARTPLFTRIMQEASVGWFAKAHTHTHTHTHINTARDVCFSASVKLKFQKWSSNTYMHPAGNRKCENSKIHHSKWIVFRDSSSPGADELATYPIIKS